MPSIPVLSLIVAALAVVVSPAVTWLVTRMQIASAQRIAVRQVVGPMRQAWINQLRKLIAELLTRTRSYVVLHSRDELSDALKVEAYERIASLGEEIELMLNPTEAPHQELAAAVKRLSDSVWPGGNQSDFMDANKLVRALTRAILKAEWNRTKSGE